MKELFIEMSCFILGCHAEWSLELKDFQWDSQYAQDLFTRAVHLFPELDTLAKRKYFSSKVIYIRKSNNGD